MRENSKLYGVELDSISGKIAKQLYQNGNIHIGGFEKTRFNDNSFDVAVGNVPFGDFKVSDKKYDRYNLKIHDYFFAKAIDKVRPGGVVALLTSKGTLDKQNESFRRYLAERCNLLGAVRLPNDTFKASAGTEAASDIIFLQKRDTLTINVPDWVHIGQTADGVPCNNYFINNPSMILGRMAFDKRMKGKFGEDSSVTTCYSNGQPLSEQLESAVSKLVRDFQLENRSFEIGRAHV